MFRQLWEVEQAEIAREIDSGDASRQMGAIDLLFAFAVAGVSEANRMLNRYALDARSAVRERAIQIRDLVNQTEQKKKGN